MLNTVYFKCKKNSTVPVYQNVYLKPVFFSIQSKYVALN